MPTADGCLHRPRPFSYSGTVCAWFAAIANMVLIAQAHRPVRWRNGLGGYDRNEQQSMSRTRSAYLSQAYGGSGAAAIRAIDALQSGAT